MTIRAISQLLADAGGLTGDELVEISRPSLTVTMTAATISAQASDNSYNDSALGFIAEGFAVSQRVRVQGFTGNVANNIYAGVITALTAGKMTIGGADGNVIVDDAEGESVTITRWESYRTSVADFITGGGAVLLDDDVTLAADSSLLAATQHATRTFVLAQIAALLDSAPGSLDTLNELAAALADDAAFSTTIINLLAGKMPLLLTVETEAGTTYTFASADSGKHKRFTSAIEADLTVPTNASDPIPVGARIRITQAGAGLLNLVPEDGSVTLNSRDAALTSAGPFAVLEIEKVATNEWDVMGDVAV